MQEFKPEYFKIAISTSLAVFGFYNDELMVLIDSKPHSPFTGAPTLPTAWVLPEQEVMDVAKDVLSNALTDQNFYLEQLNAFAKLYRKPEGRVVNIAHYSLVNISAINPEPKKPYQWVSIKEIPTLVYDHNEILTFALERLKRRVKHRPIGFRLLPKEFTIKNIHQLYEQALGKKLDKRNFSKKLMNSNLLINLDKTITEADNKKPSHLYSFNEAQYAKLSLKGYNFKF